MSRLGTLSPAAIRAMLSAESDDTLIALLTLSGAGIVGSVRIADNFTGRLSETDEDITYGVTSRGNDFVFLPLQINLPTEEESAPRATISIHDVTRYLTPVIRSITGQPSVLLELVLASTPDVVEASFPGFVLGGITYNANTVSGELTIDGLATEPFPAHSFTPPYFPGIF